MHEEVKSIYNTSKNLNYILKTSSHASLFSFLMWCSLQKTAKITYVFMFYILKPFFISEKLWENKTYSWPVEKSS